jgi:hypothetical protein
MKLRLCSSVVLSLPMSIALSGAFAWAMPGGWHQSAVLAMVLFFPLWIGILCSAFVLETTPRVLGVLALGNAGAFALLYAARALQLA